MLKQHLLRGFFACLFIGLVGACSPEAQGVAQQQAAATSTPIPTAPAVARPKYTVQRGDVQVLLEFSGRWLPRDQMSLAFEVAGTARRVEVRRGDTVNAGQLLADLQIDELENQLASAELELETAISNLQSGAEGSVRTVADVEVALANARLRLQNLKDTLPWPQLESARVNLEAAEQDFVNAQRDYDDAKSRSDQPASVVDSAYQRLQDARNNVRTSEASYFSSAQSFNSHKSSIAEAENAVIKAELDLENARQGGGDPTREQAVRSAQLRIDQIKASIAQSSLYSPLDGVVLEVNLQPGDSVTAFNAVIIVGLPEPKEVIASLAIGDAQKLSVGQIGVCQEANRPETAVQCAVRQIPLSARDADQTTRVAASFDDLASGQLVEVQMPLEVSSNVLWLPPPAIRTFQNRTFVVLETPDGPRSVDVEIGLRTDERVEIISGVNEGDVVLGP